jgi:hypothetical protein
MAWLIERAPAGEVFSAQGRGEMLFRQVAVKIKPVGQSRLVIVHDVKAVKGPGGMFSVECDAGLFGLMLFHYSLARDRQRAR